VIAIAFYLVVGAIALKTSGLKLRTYLPSLAFPNAGNLGLPLALYAAGQEGLNDAIIIFAVTSIINMTAGQVIAAGRGNWGRALRSPIIPAVALGVICAYFGVALPLWLTNTLSLLSGLTIPLMLLMLGTSLAKIQVTGFPRAAALSVLRISMGAVAGFRARERLRLRGAGAHCFRRAMRHARCGLQLPSSRRCTTTIRKTSQAWSSFRPCWPW